MTSPLDMVHVWDRPKTPRGWLESLGSTGLGGFGPALENMTPDEQRYMARLQEAMMASAADPLQIASGVVGIASPQMRDSWRAVQNQEGPMPAIAGGLLSGGGAVGAVAKGIKSIPGLMAAGAGMNMASDGLDAIAGKDDAINVGTLHKGAFGSALGIPPKVAMGVGGVGALGSALANFFGSTPAGAQSPTAPAGAQSPTLADRVRGNPQLEALHAEMQRLDAESKAKVPERGSKESFTIRARAGEQANIVRSKILDLLSATAKGEEDSQRGLDSAMLRRAEAARDGVEQGARKPFAETSIGQHFNPGVMPFLALAGGGAVGAAFGRAANSSSRASKKAWDDAVESGLTTSSPSEKLAKSQLADHYNSQVFPTPAPKAGMAPVITAGGLGGSVMNVPEAYDLTLPKENPKRAALMAYATELRPDHPEALRVKDLLADPTRYPEENPALTAARENYTSGNFLLRSGSGMAAAGAAAGGVRKLTGLLGPNEGQLPRAQTTLLKGQVGKDVDETALMIASRQRADADALQSGLRRDASALETGRQQDLQARLAETARGRIEEGLQRLGSTRLNKQELSDLRQRLGQAPTLTPALDPALVPSPLLPLNVPMNVPMKVPMNGATKGPRPQDPADGEWASLWSPAARDVVSERVAAGGNIKGGRGGLTAQSLADQIAERLPVGVSAPSRQVTQDRVGLLRKDIGDSPTSAELAKHLKRIANSRFALPISIGATGGMLSSSDDALRELLMMGLIGGGQSPDSRRPDSRRPGLLNIPIR